MLELCKHKKVQERLRDEILEAFPDDTTLVTIEALNSLPYLEAVIRETLRYAPALENISREAHADDVVPVEKPYMLKDGTMRDYIEYVG
jgi:cytochrome P450